MKTLKATLLMAVLPLCYGCAVSNASESAVPMAEEADADALPHVLASVACGFNGRNGAVERLSDSPGQQGAEELLADLSRDALSLYVDPG